MTPDARDTRWGVWLKWVIGSAAGAAAVSLLARRVSMAVGGATGPGTSDIAAEAVTGTVALGGIMLAIAAGQWLSVGRQAPWGSRVLLATCVAGALGGAATLGVWSAAGRSAGPTLAVIAGVTVGLAAFGLVHWLVLRRHVPWAGRWAAASIVALAVAWMSVGVAGALAPEGPEVLYGAVFGAAYGAITGGALLRLLRHPAGGNGEPIAVPS